MPSLKYTNLTISYFCVFLIKLKIKKLKTSYPENKMHAPKIQDHTMSSSIIPSIITTNIHRKLLAPSPTSDSTQTTNPFILAVAITASGTGLITQLKEKRVPPQPVTEWGKRTKLT